MMWMVMSKPKGVSLWVRLRKDFHESIALAWTSLANREDLHSHYAINLEFHTNLSEQQLSVICAEMVKLLEVPNQQRSCNVYLHTQSQQE
jgi:hypothetical protein